MGGFTSLLGHAAGGFEQARQQDLSRQFADEQNRRAMAGELLHTLALDPNQHPDVRNGALQSYLGLSQMPLNKQYNFSKEIQPLFDLMAKYRAAGATAQQQGPTVPPVQAQLPPQPDVAGGIVPSTARAAQAIGAGGPPAPTGQAPQASAPPAPPATLLAGIPEIAQNTAMLSGAKSGGELGGQLAVKREVAEGLLNDPKWGPVIQQDPMMIGMLTASMMGTNIPFGAMFRNVGAGTSVPGSQILQDNPNAKGIDPNAFYNIRQTPMGPTYTRTAGAGEKATGPGELGTAAQVAGQVTTAQQQAKFPFDVKKIGIHFANSLALQNNAFGLAMQRGAYQDANNIFFKAQDDYMKRQGALRVMEENYKDALKGNQQAQVSMLFNHIGMTSGAVPGSRQSRATIEEAEASTPWLKGVIAKWFHQDENGDYVFDGLKGGINLNKQQMDQMIDLAKQRVAVQKDQVTNYQDQLGGGGEFTPPSISAIGGGRPKAQQPPKPSAGSATSHQSFADWKKSQAGATQ